MRLFHLTVFIAVSVFYAFVFSASASAQIQPLQNAPTPNISNSSGQVNIAEADPATWTGILDSATRALEREGLTARELDGISAQAGRIRDAASASIPGLQTRVDEINQQLSGLGPKPAEGEPPETPEAQSRREVVNEQFAKADAQLKAARLAVLRAQQIQQTVGQKRQSRFFSSITVKTEGLFTASYWSKFFNGFQGYYRSLSILFKDSFSIMGKEFLKRPWKQFAFPFLLCLLGLVYFRARRYLLSIANPDEAGGEAEFYQSRFIRFCLRGVLPVLAIYGVYKIFWELFLLTQRLDELVVGILVALCFFILSIALLRILLVQKLGKSRLINIGDAAANRVLRVVTVGLGLGMALLALNLISLALVAPIEVTVGWSFFYSICTALTFISVLLILRSDRLSQADGVVTDPSQRSGLWYYINIVVWLVSLAILGSAIMGYVALAEFLSQQLVFGLVVVGTVWLVLRFIDRSVAPRLELNPFMDKSEASSQRDMRRAQAVILATGFLKLLIYCFAGILLMLPWGYRTSDFFQIFQSAFFGFEIGGLSISVSTVLLALGLFALGYTVTIALRNWLNNRFLPTTNFDIGISNSISTVFGYIGFILAAILAISAAGFDLSNLAIVAGALSVGIGFGLQSIVGNFVSGLILLAERPIKAGDWIVTAGGEGTVRRISVRSTEIETFDRATVIVPNSTLITDNVTNWTHGNKSGRIIIPVGVGYDSDPEKVREILLACAKEHRLVLGRPEPVVFFMDFGASSLDFQLRCFLADINYSIVVSSELRFAILKALREADIEIPFPQRDIHIRSDSSKE